MAYFNDRFSAWPGIAKLAVGAALLATGGAVGAGIAHFERPAIQMAPNSATPIGKLAGASGIVTVRGRVAETYGDSFVLADGSGRTLIRAGHDATAPAAGSTVTVQGRIDDGQLRPSFLVDQAGVVTPLGRHGHGKHEGREGRDHHDRDDDGDRAPQPAPAVAPAPQSGATPAG